ncbi:MAG: hypothetical protein NW224_08750 [Leptolyngbyaceae cyanobacterium bins.302]|nr:hypothetical protein [Leptolyngbyaceae cyanobacterium bins.302]
MLVRLEHALNCPNLAKQMMLVPKASNLLVPTDINLVVGYNGSTRSQTALDLTLWIAHQTRLVTRRAVTVQVVYVVDQNDDRSSDRPSVQDTFLDLPSSPVAIYPTLPSYVPISADPCPELIETVAHGRVATRCASPVISDWSETVPPVSQATNKQIHQFEKADRILWQARHLADEWRGSLETHLRFGNLVEELRSAACQVSTTALVLGCSERSDPIVQALGRDLPFPILGIPTKISPS